jgi:DNA-binding protein YbaB
MSQADKLRKDILAGSAGQAQDIAESAAEGAQKLETVNNLLRELTATEFTGEGGGGLVTAGVNGMCEIQSVYVSPTAMRELSHETLGTAVVQAVEKARATALEQVAQRMQETTGEKPVPVEELKLPANPLEDYMNKLRNLGEAQGR